MSATPGTPVSEIRHHSARLSESIIPADQGSMHYERTPRFRRLKLRWLRHLVSLHCNRKTEGCGQVMKRECFFNTHRRLHSQRRRVILHLQIFQVDPDTLFAGLLVNDVSNIDPSQKGNGIPSKESTAAITNDCPKHFSNNDRGWNSSSSRTFRGHTDKLRSITSFHVCILDESSRNDVSRSFCSRLWGKA